MKVRWWSVVLCSCYWSLILQMESLLAFIGKKNSSALVSYWEQTERLHMSNRAVVRERGSEHTEAVNSSRNGLHVAARARACPAASMFSAVIVVFQLAVMCGSGVTSHKIIYYIQYTERCTYSLALWLKPLILTLSFVKLTWPFQAFLIWQSRDLITVLEKCANPAGIKRSYSSC